MKKINAFSMYNLIGLIIGYFAIFRLLKTSDEGVISGLNFPPAFPSKTGLLVIWALLFVFWGIGVCFVYTAALSQRSKRNIFLNGIILVIGIFIWHFMIFSNANPSGALAICIAVLILSVVVWFMYLVSHRYGGYLFTSTVVWLLFTLYLSIALVIKN